VSTQEYWWVLYCIFTRKDDIRRGSLPTVCFFLHTYIYPSFQNLVGGSWYNWSASVFYFPVYTSEDMHKKTAKLHFVRINIEIDTKSDNICVLFFFRGCNILNSFSRSYFSKNCNFFLWTTVSCNFSSFLSKRILPYLYIMGISKFTKSVSFINLRFFAGRDILVRHIFVYIAIFSLRHRWYCIVSLRGKMTYAAAPCRRYVSFYIHTFTHLFKTSLEEADIIDQRPCSISLSTHEDVHKKTAKLHFVRIYRN